MRAGFSQAPGGVGASQTLAPHGRPRGAAGKWERLLLLLALAGTLLLSTGRAAETGAPPSQVLPLLTNIQQVRALSPAEVRLRYPVKVSAVVTYYDPKWDSLFVQDATGGCYVFPTNRPRPRLQPGQLVELSGRSGGGFSRTILENSLEVAGTAPLPAPVRMSFDELVSGRGDAQWIELEAVVRAMRTEYQRTYLHLAAGNGRFQAHLPNPDRQPLPKHLLHARVRIRGVSGIVLSQKGQIIGARVYVPGLDFIEVLDPRAVDPFRLPVQPLLSLFDAVPREVTTPRIHVAGVVTLHWPASGTVFIQGARGGLELKLTKKVPLADPPDREAEVYSDPKPVELKVGDRVEAVGYPEMRESAPLLEDAEIRRLQEGQPPVPVVLNAAQVMKGTNDAELVQIEGRLLEVASRTTDDFHEQVLVMQSDNAIFEARLEADPAASLSVPAHSVVQLTGVCSVSLNALHEPRGFQILLRSPADIRVLDTPPLWTRVSPAKLATTTGALGVAVLGWIWLLRRRVRDKTAELSASEARYRTMVEHAPEAIVILDADTGRFIEANDNAARLLGYSREDLLQRGPRDISPPLQPDGRPSADVAQEKIAETLAGGRPAFEWVHRATDGREIPCEIRLVRLPALSCNRVQGSITDITERKRAEEELIKALAREKELSELKSNFVSMVSHEYRNPLEIIQSSSDILLRYHDKLPPEKRVHHLQGIQKSVKRMSDLMEEVLLLGKVEAGQIEFKPQPLDLTAFCRGLVEEVGSATANRCPMNFESDAAPTVAQGDESLLRLVFINLLSNAVKYSAPGRPVRWTLNEEQGLAVFRVIDQGLGIPLADQSRLFQAFHRGRNTGHAPGTGLGLVIVKRCVQLHGGRIHCESREGAGTTFIVWLPLFGQALDPDRETAFFHRQSQKS